jgi:Ca2+-binding EF-hand superfamily protein
MCVTPKFVVSVPKFAHLTVDIDWLTCYLIQLFDEYKQDDDDEPAYVPFTKLRKILAAATYDFTNKQLRLCRSLCDSDKSGRMEFEELLDLFIYLKWLQVAFDKADKDGSNSISEEEVLSALSFLGHKLETSKAKRIFSKVDTDRSNGLCFAEFFEFTMEAKIDVRNLEYEDDGNAVEFES